VGKAAMLGKTLLGLSAAGEVAKTWRCFWALTRVPTVTGVDKQNS